ncbi:BatD family protein [Dokdonia sp. Hel_I_53]|uniref:BatD family protein n=1 Tax=Dokdonia sp. Hel_I_53 TaxID=1566287 RepID=UPI00119B6DFE|nr:BatD family protein [Dokdonia sp. Hel_I_53]TVZ52804.1 oxygen tolerance protein BatD [Dokdonia sp. Hel_I_53]
MKKVFLILSILLLTVSTLFSQDVEFTAKTNLKKLGLNERLRVEFSMNQDGDNFTPPSFQGFTVVGGPSQTTSRQWVNGKSSFSKSFSYFLSPNAQGTIRIGPAQITVNGEIYKSQPIDITVTGAVEKPTDPNDVSFIAKENIHLVAEISKASPFVNEAFTVVYKLYVAERTSVSTWRETESPKFADFWSQNIDEKQFKVYEGEYQGEPYRYVILRRTVLYPQKTGKLEIEPLGLNVAVSVPTNRRDIFGRTLTKSTNIAVKAQKRIINVRPLPQPGKPDDFTGAVGDFDFAVRIDKNELDAGEALELTVEVQGRGNLKLFELPAPNLPSSLEVYEPQNDDKIRTNLAGMSGVKKQVFTIVPQFKGSYPIPPLSFSYFNPATEKYERQTSKGLVIEVKNGPTAAVGTVSQNGDVQKQAVVSSNTQFQYIKNDTNLKAITKERFFKSTLFWSLAITPFLMIPLAMLVRKKREAYVNDVSGNRIRKADKLARKYLSTARKNLGNQKEFYIAMERALHNYLKAKLTITTSEMSKDRISRLLKEKDVDDATSIEFISLLESCEFARYTPSSNTAMQQDYDKAVRVISQLDKQL